MRSTSVAEHISATLDTRTRDLVCTRRPGDRVRQSVAEFTRSTITTVTTEGQRTIAGLKVGEVQRQLRETMEQSTGTTVETVARESARG